MFSHFLRVAVRNILKYKVFSFVNIIGLALGMFTFLVIIGLLAEHMSFDADNTKKERIYRIFSINETTGANKATSPFPVLAELKDKFPGIEKYVRFERGFGNDLGNQLIEKASIPIAGFFAGPEVFDILEYELEYGDAKTALVDPYTVVLTKKTAMRLFSKDDPVGEFINVGDIGVYTVTGVLKETPRRSHIKFEALASLATVSSLAALDKSLEPAGIARPKLEDWQSVHNGWNYILLSEGKAASDLQTYLNEISNLHYSSQQDDQLKWKFGLQPLTEITPGYPKANEIGAVLDWRIIYMISTLALVVLAIACFNFTNLSIARSLSRAMEIGVRKVNGGTRWQIFLQFVLESVSISVLALVLAIGMVILLNPVLFNLTPFQMAQLSFGLNIYMILIFLLFAVFIGCLAGLFPAAVLSGLSPVSVLRGTTNVKLISKMSLRKALLTIQFSVALVFIITTIVVYNQLELFLSTDHGFEMKNNLVIKLNRTSATLLKTELSKSSVVFDVTASSHVPSTFLRYNGSFKKESDTEWYNFCYYSVDEGYLENMNTPLVAGNFFDTDKGGSNSGFAIINERMVGTLHYDTPLSAIGERIMYARDSSTLEIIGVVKDYNHNMLTQQIEPMVLIYNPAEFNIMQVRYNDRPQAYAAVESAWKKINPDRKIEYIEIAEEVSKFYTLVVGDIIKMLLLIACLAVTICCLGLLGIVSFTTEVRMREVSIRKVFGSSNRDILFLLSKSYFKIFIVSILIGSPLAFIINNMWLRGITYRTTVGAGVIFAGVGVLIILAGVTVYSQAVKAIVSKVSSHLKVE